MEAEERRNEKEMQAEERKREMEAVERRKEKEIELEKLKLEADMNFRNISHQRGVTDEIGEYILPMENDSSKMKEIENYRRILKALVPRVPSDPGELPCFFQVVEGVFRSQSIPQELQGHLIAPLLEEKMQPLLVSLTEEKLKDYESVKEEILRLNKLTSAEYRKRFDDLRKLKGQTWPQYVQKLSSYWHFYTSSKKADSVSKINNLIILDRLKRELPEETRSYINLREADGTMTSEEAAQMAEIHESATDKYGTCGRYRENYQSQTERRNHAYHKGDTTKYYGRGEIRGEDSRRSYQTYESKFKKDTECFRCGGKGHIARYCLKQENVRKKPEVRVQAVEFKPRASDAEKDLAVSARVHSEIFDLNQRGTPCTPKLSELKMTKIRYRNKTLNAVIDSGTQICVLREEILDEKDKYPKGRIILQPAFGKSREANLVEIKLSLDNDINDSISPVIQAIVASCDDLNADALLDLETYEALKRQNREYVGLSLNDTEQISDVQTKADTESILADVETVILDSDEIQETELSDRSIFLKEQRECDTLVDVWKIGEVNKKNFVVIDDLLYHKGEIAKQSVHQLVVPSERRSEILKLAHKSVTGAHMGEKKTGDRIKLTFWWPNINDDVKKFCSTCAECQLRARERVKDRVPITAIARPELPFQILNIDIIGPISPVSAKGNAYVLTVMDYCTRWVEAVPLRTITAKNTCNALLTIFMRLGIPSIIASDQGRNFTAELTNEIYKVLGVSPRFSTPGHAESNGLVERWNGVLKNMLHHVIRDDPKHWDLQIPFLLWAYREVPHSTTGVSPFVLMYGREATGPLSILKEMWIENNPLPLFKVKSTEKYLQELKSRMDKAAEIAKITSEYKQELMCHNYNTRSKAKDFNVGDLVVVLIPDSTNKIYARWRGPAKVVKRERPNSYVVKFDDGKHKTIHVNKLRPFKTPVNMVGVVFEADHEFGEIDFTPVKVEDDHTKKHDLVEGNISEKQREDLDQIISKYRNTFNGKMRKALVSEHRIRIKGNSFYRKPHIYRIPEAMKKKVEDQIEELLTEGFIEPCVSEYAHPIVCAAKKNGELRLCIDYRALNSITEVDAFPMENIKELMMIVAKSNFISLLDLRKGYWQIPLAENSKMMSAFVTHQGQYVWNVMPFGLKGASATFQRAMNEALTPHRKYARAYIDDIAIFSDTWEEHLHHIEAVLATLEKRKLSINLEKCEFAKPEIKYLGHVIGSGKHRPDPEKLKVIESMVRPNTKPELRRILGLFNYYRDYVSNFSSLAYPLTEMTKKNKPNVLDWNKESIGAFEKLKENLCKATVCYAPNIESDFIIYTDASQIGVGAVLAQEDEAKKIRPIAFASAKLDTTQQLWSVAEREAYAVVWALKKFEVWTFGSKIEIVTDNNPLKFLTSSSSPSPKLHRWSLALQRYDLVITHRKGADHVNADTLSRL